MHIILIFIYLVIKKKWLRAFGTKKIHKLHIESKNMKKFCLKRIKVTKIVAKRNRSFVAIYLLNCLYVYLVVCIEVFFLKSMQL
jgi:hypothetical protein